MPILQYITKGSLIMDPLLVDRMIKMAIMDPLLVDRMIKMATMYFQLGRT